MMRGPAWKVGLVKKLTKALVGRAIHTELTDHLGHEKHQTTGRASQKRNGTSKTTQKDEIGLSRHHGGGGFAAMHESVAVCGHSNRCSNWNSLIPTVKAIPFS